MTSLKHIALFGGSFDPPHLGHIALVKAALEHLHIDELWLIPVGLPVHRKLSGKATDTQRLDWLSEIFNDEEPVKIVDWEMQNSNPTPAIDTLRRFQKENQHMIPTWLMGMDSFLDLPNWVDYPEHQKLCNLAVFHRKGVKDDVITNTWKSIGLLEWQNQRPQLAGHMVCLDVDLPHVSSTHIRQNAKANKALLAQSNCNAILACYDSDLRNHKERDT